MGRHYQHLGIFYIDSVHEEMTVGNIEVMEDYGIAIPHIGIYYDGLSIYNKYENPNLIVTTPNLIYLLSVIPYIIRAFGWSNIVLFYGNIYSDEGMEVFKAIQKKLY